ncbi:MAG: M28 family peptidase [Chitinophagaceae bacterium]
MQKTFYTVLLVSATLLSTAQTTSEKYTATITATDLKKHLVIIAGPEMEGRETATEGQKKAAAYIEDYFKALGLKPGNNGSFQQVFPLMEDTLVSSRIQIGANEYSYGKDYMMSARINNSGDAKANSIVFAGYGISDSLYDDYANLDVKNAIVVLALGEPKINDKFIITGTNRASAWSTLAMKRQLAIEKGAVGIFVVSPRLVNIDSSSAANQRKTGAYLFGKQAEEVPAINVASISQKVFKEIFPGEFGSSMLKKLDSNQVFAQAEHVSTGKKTIFHYTERIYEKANSSNVVATLEGSDKKDEFVFLTAHYDHLGKRGNIVYYGADDDGSGTVAVLEMAEAFSRAKADGRGPRRSIVFMTVSGEEKGLWGSEYYSDHPIFPLEKTTADLNTDMVGRIDPKRKTGDSLNYLYVIGDNKLSSDLKPISESINNQYTQLELDYKYNDPADPERIYYRSDHYNFARKGVPVLFYFSGTHADYHRPTDTVDKINFELMEKRVHFIFNTAWEIANRNNMLKRDLAL